MSIGILSLAVWPTFVGVLDRTGQEPAGDYSRGQITWETDQSGEIVGHASILVPAGYYTELAYYHGPNSGLTVGHQQFEHPMPFQEPGRVDLHHITKADFTQLPTRNGFRLPV